ncbi:MAG: hypothetical protein ACLUE8_02515 [Lachnospiraceae bacterium]
MTSASITNLTTKDAAPNVGDRLQAVYEPASASVKLRTWYAVDDAGNTTVISNAQTVDVDPVASARPSVWWWKAPRAMPATGSQQTVNTGRRSTLPT